MQVLHRAALSVLLALPIAPLAQTETPRATSAAAKLPTAADFVRPPAISDVRLSPSGTRLALLLNRPGGRRALAVADIAAPEILRVIAEYGDASVRDVWWVNDQRLVYVASVPGVVIERGGRGIFAIDHDGGRQQHLVAWDNDPNSTTGTLIVSRKLSYQWEVHSTIQDGSDEIVMRYWPRTVAGDVSAGHLSRLDTVTMRLRNLSAGMPSPATRALLDAKGTVRVVQSDKEGRTRLHWRAPGSDEWVLLEDRETYDERGLVPVALDGEDELIVETRVGGDTSALHAYKLREKKLDPEPIVAIKGFDIGRAVRTAGANGRPIGVYTRASMPVSVWFSEHLAQAQGTVDKALPAGRSNTLICGRCDAGAPMVVHSASDTEPGEWYLYDPGKRSLRRFGSARPWLAGVPQGRRTAHRVDARDGLSMPVWVTHPPGSDPGQPLPAVVLVHGGPWSRGGSQLWDDEAQFFASRGWRVIEPEFRGSTGFGWKHFSAGWKQWGLAMQDDLADALAWAVQQKLVDPAKVCIYGSSYGGYAALMGPIRHPQAYRCAASYVGVTDIGLMYTATWGDLTLDNKRFTMPMLVGDPRNDAEALRRSSPLQRVAEIRVPVLLGQGLEDRRVPKEHADKFERAAKAAGVAIERVDYYDEGHGFSLASNHADWLQRLEAFFAKAFAKP
jgi:dipeptidyl aminopeptidase/acylaminoacyl peptidase